MRKIALAVVLLLGLSLSGTAQDARTNELFNFNWKFNLGNVERAETPNFDDSEWLMLDLPHDFQIGMPWNEKASAQRGFKDMEIGWYRKTFEAKPEWKDKKVLLDFEGIMVHGDVWLNGEKVGETDYGYLGFDCDITKLLKYDAPNVIAVKSSTGKKQGSRWYTGGGLYRDVHLVVKDPISIARNGVYITTPEVSTASSSVNIQVEMEGITGKHDDIMITANILSPSGENVGKTESLIIKGSRLKQVEVQLPSLEIKNAQLWDCEHPNLYTAEITITKDSQLLDNLTQRFGFRTIEFSKEFGFKLNGKKVYLKGLSGHHDMGAVGAAAHETAIARQMDVLKQFGFNHIRCSHNPYSKAFLELADQKGILIVNELYDKWSNKDYWVGRRPWTELVFENIPEWVKRDRSHPSVIMWSLGNELQMREDLAGFPTSDWGVTTYKMLDVLVKRYDTTRPTTVGMYPSRANALSRKGRGFWDEDKMLPPELAVVTEVSSFNYQFEAYQQYLKYEPDMIVYQSEATTNRMLAPFWGMDSERMVGLAYWGAIEYWGESSGWPRKGWAYSYFNHALEPFPQAYMMKSAFLEDEPMVHIGVAQSEKEDIDWNDVTIGHIDLLENWNQVKAGTQTIFTFTNADEVELLLNGKSIGVQKNDRSNIEVRNKIIWENVPFEAGKLVAIARTGGKEVARHEIATTGEAVALQIVAEDNGEWNANGMDLQYISVYALDKKGRRVYDATQEVTFNVSGSAKLIAVDNGNHRSNELFSGNKRQLYRGTALAILRATQTAGKVQVKASASGLKSASVKLEVK